MKYRPLPKFEPITIENVSDCSTLLFYGGPWVTEWFGNHIYKHQYKPPAYHAAFYIERGRYLNVSKFKSVTKITDDFLSNRRIDVISYKYIRKDQVDLLKDAAYADADKAKLARLVPTYDWKGFLRFGLKFIRQSKGNDFCSENVVQLFATQKIKVSKFIDYNTAPWDLFDYAMENPDQCKVRTLWTGGQFK